MGFFIKCTLNEFNDVSSLIILGFVHTVLVKDTILDRLVKENIFDDDWTWLIQRLFFLLDFDSVVYY